MRSSSEAFVVRQNLPHGIQAAETGQAQIRHRLFDLRHPAFHRGFNSTRHLSGNSIDEVACAYQSDYTPFFVSGQWPVVIDQSTPLTTDH